MEESTPQSPAVVQEDKAEWLELTRPLAKRRPPAGRGSGVGGQQVITMTGMVKRGDQLGSPVDVELELTDVELRRLTSREARCVRGGAWCGRDRGPHVSLLSLLFLPLACLSSAAMAFYFGVMTWFNFYVYFSEERSLWLKVVVCPLLLLTFPFWAPLTALGVGAYAALVQLSWFLDAWLLEVRDLEKGFYAWFCHCVRLPQCSPYEVVILDESDAFPDKS